MIEPLSTAAHVSALRIVGEAAAAAGVSVFAFTLTGDEVGIAVTVLSAAAGVIVWMVRLEGRINTNNALLDSALRRLDRMADHMGVPE